MADPTVLSFDTSGPYCAVALLRGGEIVATRHVPMAKGQAEHLMPLVMGVLAEAGVVPAALDALGVGTGPGNFTGVRISVAAARGLALALGIPAVGVSGLEALALDGPRPLLACIDARRDQVYLQRFGGGATRGPELVGPDTVPDWAMAGLSVVGHASAELAARIGARAVPAAHESASAIARIAATRFQDRDLLRPAPLYLRAADAAPSKETGPVMLS